MVLTSLVATQHVHGENRLSSEWGGDEGVGVGEVEWRKW